MNIPRVIHFHDLIYPAFFVASFIVGMRVCFREYPKWGLSKAYAAKVLLLAVLGGRFFALLLYSWENDDWSTNPLVYLSFGMMHGSSQYGAIYGGLLSITLYSLWKKVPPLKTFDLGVPAIAVAFFWGRLGCFFSDCCRGIPLSPEHYLPDWFPFNYQFPASLVDGLLNLGIFYILIRMPVEENRFGKRLGWYLILTSIMRFFVEYVRTSDEVLWHFTLVQAMALPLTLLGTAFVRGWHSKAYAWLKDGLNASHSAASRKL